MELLLQMFCFCVVKFFLPLRPVEAGVPVQLYKKIILIEEQHPGKEDEESEYEFIAEEFRNVPPFDAFSYFFYCEHFYPQKYLL